MARILGQIRCGRCGERFWPEREASTSLLVVCRRCGGAHANPDALPTGAHRTTSIDLERWLNRYWIDAIPPDVRFVKAASIGGVDGFACASTISAEKESRYTPERQWTTLLIAALPSRNGARAPQDMGTSRCGVYAVHEGWMPRDHLAASFHAMAAALRAEGWEPIFGIDEVADPTPMTSAANEADPPDQAADAMLSAQSVRCTTCGAPSSVASLLGAHARCPFCATPQALPPEIAHALVLYQRRLRAAMLRAPQMTLAGAYAPSLAQPGVVTLACMQCGAPSPHRAGALDEHCPSCRAPLIPSHAAMQQAVAREAKITGAAHGRGAAADARNFVGKYRKELITGIAAIATVALGFGALHALPIVDSLARAGDPMKALEQLASTVCPIVGWVLMLAAIALATLLSARKVKRERVGRWTPRFSALADQLGTTTSTVDQLIDWSERWWNDRLAKKWIIESATQGIFTFALDGFPIAISADIESNAAFTFLTPSNEPHAAVLLAARLPQDSPYWARTPEAKARIQALEQAGFKLELRTGGLALQATTTAMQSFKSQPDRVAMLAPVASALAKLAHHLRAEAPV